MLILYHVFVLTVNLFGLWYGQTYINFPFLPKETTVLPFKGRVLFYTFWCMLLQITYFTIALLNDILGTNASNKNLPFIRKFKDVICSLAFAVALQVTAAFWGIYAVEKDLIYPEMIAKEIPTWINHLMHTFTTIFILLDVLFSRPQYPNRKTGLAVLLAYNAIYGIWIHFLYYKAGIWVYPVLGINLPLRLTVMLLFVTLACGSYVLGEKLSHMVAPSNRPKSKEKSKKRK